MESASQEVPALAKRKQYMRSQVLWIQPPRVDRKGAARATGKTQAIWIASTLPVKRQDALLHDPGR